MSRITDSLKRSKLPLGEYASPYLDLKYGGQNGLIPRVGHVGLDNKVYDEWISNHAYIKRNIIPIVVSYPKFFDLLPDKEHWIATYKALIELHPLTIDGLSSGLTVETDEHPIGGGGEFQEEITDVKRARSSLSFTYKEKAGKSIQKFLDAVIRYGYMDPDTKKPLITKYFKKTSGSVDFGGMYTPDFYTGAVMFIEPDITHREVVDAWFCTNMFFKGNGERTGKRDIRSPGEAPELSIESSAITLNNAAVIGLAKTMLDTLVISNTLPEERIFPGSDTVDPKLNMQDVGYTRDR